MTDTIKLSDLGFSDLPGKRSRRSATSRGTIRKNGGPHQPHTARELASASLSHETGSPLVATPRCGAEMRCAPPCELDRLYRSLADVTPRNHPRTARLLASSTRKTAQKVIEEAGEVAIEAVKHRERRSALPRGRAVASRRHRSGGCLDRDARARRRARHCREAAQSAQQRQSQPPDPDHQATAREEPTMTVINEQPASRKPGSARQKGADAAGALALEPAIQAPLASCARAPACSITSLIWHRIGVRPEHFSAEMRLGAAAPGRAQERERHPFP
jgi:hypothetical protein